jgi:hypothetical protein
VAKGRGLAVWALPESTATPEEAKRLYDQHVEWTLKNVDQYGRQQGPPLQ